MTTLSELKSELAKTDQLLYATWLQEREAARRRIVELAVDFQLSPSTVAKDVEAAQRSAPPAPSVLRAPSVDLPLRSAGTPQHIEAKYRNVATGESWTGRGPRPRWLRDALRAGALLEDYLVDATQHAGPGDPLRAFQDAAQRAWLTDRT
jgi:DNA-binding protein H-NS